MLVCMEIHLHIVTEPLCIGLDRDADIFGVKSTRAIFRKGLVKDELKFTVNG